MKVYNDNKNRKSQSISLSKYFKSLVEFIVKEKELINWIVFIIKEGLLLSVIKKKIYQRFRDTSIYFSIKTIKDTIFEIVLIVEVCIG